MKFGTNSDGLGDILLLTSICKFFNEKPTIQLKEKHKRFSILFDNLANIEITENINNIPDIGHNGHYATRKLRNFFNHADYLDNRPLVLFSNENSETWAFNFLKEIRKPIIFVPKCSPQWDSVRSINFDKCLEIIDFLKNQQFTPILCTSSKNDIDLNGCIKLVDLDLDKYICLLRRVGHYIGCNTGDMNLAISVGCLVEVFQPKNNPFFNENEWNYNHPSISYHKL